MSKVETNSVIHEMKDGIMYLYIKPGMPNIKDIKESTDYLKSLDQQLLIYCDPTDATVLEKQQRKFLADELEDIVIAFAMKEVNLLSKLVYNFVSKILQPKFHFKLFSEEEEAIVWLKKISQPHSAAS